MPRSEAAHGEGTPPCGSTETSEGIRRGAKRPAVMDLTAFGRQIQSQTLEIRRERVRSPEGVVTPEGFEPSIFALKGRRANRCTTGSLHEATAGPRSLPQRTEMSNGAPPVLCRDARKPQENGAPEGPKAQWKPPDRTRNAPGRRRTEPPARRLSRPGQRVVLGADAGGLGL